MKDRWFEAFRQDPEQALSDLFTGRAGLGSAMRLGVPELLQQWVSTEFGGGARTVTPSSAHSAI